MNLKSLFADAPIDCEVAGLSADSRRVREGYVFAALAGQSAHGGAFVAQAKAAGAIAVLSAGDADPQGLPHIVVANPRRALAMAASRFYPRAPGVRVAVTGTNGKSSTVDFLRQIWAHAGVEAASLGTLGAISSRGVSDLGHTTADPVQLHEMLQSLNDAGVTHVAMEASSHGLDQYRLDGLRFQAGAFLNLTQDHLDYHGDMDAYRRAKLRLWELLEAGGPAIINADSPDAEAFAEAATARGLRIVLTGWRAPEREGLKIEEIQPRPAGQTLSLLWNGAGVEIELPLIGEFQALNAVAAAALALSLNAPAPLVWSAMAGLKPVKGRMEHIGAKSNGAHVFVDYAHTPDGLDMLLRAARPHAAGRVVLVFGCGGDRDKNKRAKMGAVAQRHADLVIVTDDNPRSEEPSAIRAQILAACPKAQEIGARADAIRAGIGLLQKGDALLIAGKGHETGQIIQGVTHPFSDQEEARKALA